MVDADELIARATRALTGVLLWPVLIAIALGSGLWAHAHPAELPLLATNKLPHPLRIQTLLWVAAAFGAVCSAASRKNRKAPLPLPLPPTPRRRLRHGRLRLRRRQATPNLKGGSRVSRRA